MKHLSKTEQSQIREGVTAFRDAKEAPSYLNLTHYVKTIGEALEVLHTSSEHAIRQAQQSRERIYVARGGNMWGKGFTPIQAVEAALAAGGHATTAKRPRKYLSVYKLPHGAYGVGVDGMGTIHWSVMWGAEGGEAEEISEQEWTR